MTELVHHLVGDDRSTDKVAYEHAIPSEKWNAIRKFLPAAEDDPSIADEPTVRDIMKVIQSSLRKDLDYFIECSSRD